MSGTDPSLRHSAVLARVGGFLIRRARLVVLLWAVLTAVLALQGLDLDKKLSVHPIYIGGTSTKEEHEISLREFGNEDALVVMLRGPEGAVESQGRRLADRLEAMPGSLVVTPWTPGAALGGLSPNPRVGAILVSLPHRANETPAAVGESVQRLVDGSVSRPVRASLSGGPKLTDSLQNAVKTAAQSGELIAIPVLLLVLLFVFRSLLAAAMPVVIGGAVVAATRGVVDQLLGAVQIDSFAIGAVAMMGLALGVDYSLLVVSRFREEYAKSEDVDEAVQITLMAIGRSVIPAATGLVAAMIVASQVVPGAIADSVSIAIIIATILSALSALLVVPSFLVLLGSRLDRWSLPPRRRGTGALRRARWVAKRPGVALPVLFVMLVLAGWAFTLDTGVATFALLPPGDSGRRQSEEVQQTLGTGWTSPMEIVMDGGAKPVTTPHRMHALFRFQRRVERDPGVKTMAGFTAFERGTNQLEGFESNLVKQERGLVHLSHGLARVGTGAESNTEGLLSATEGADQLSSAVGETHAGAGALASGLQNASKGTTKLSQGLGHASDGSGRLADGTSKASTGLGHLTEALQRAVKRSGQSSSSARLIRNAMKAGNRGLAELKVPLQGAEAQLETALQALRRMTPAGRGDPQYAAVLRAVEEASQNLSGKEPSTGEQADPDYEGLGGGVEQAGGQFDLGIYLANKVGKNGRQGHKGAKKLARLSGNLNHGLQKLAKASQQVSAGIARLSRGGHALSPGLQRLSVGAERLQAGLGEVQAGSGELAGGLGSGAHRSTLLTGAIHKIGSGVGGQQGKGSGGSGLHQLHAQSPGLFHSGYFLLAGFDGGSPKRQEQAGFLVNLDRGGHDARMLVIPRDEPGSAAGKETTARLQEDSDQLARETGSKVLVGGVGPSESDVNTALRDEAPWTRLALSLVTFLILIPVVRSLILPLLAALINVLTVGATFGLLSLLFNGSLLGGPGYVDATVLPATMIVIFGLAIDYEVFVFARMREEYLRTGSPSAAVTNGLQRVGPVVTGAALIMIAVFLAFAASPFATLRDFGVAQAIAVFIDAFIVRLVVVPSLMRMLGHRSWWLPRWLDRLLPGGRPVAGEAPKVAEA
jgi:RND superfamily putative drug exporter